jgi:hypothetical protein
MSMTSRFMAVARCRAEPLAAAAIPLVAQGQEGRDAASQKPTDVRIASYNLTLTATIYDNPTARDLASMLPLDLNDRGLRGLSATPQS